MKKLLFLFFISVFVFACEKKERFLDNDVSDADQSEEQKDIDEIPDEDVEENWHIAPVVKCEKDSDCPDPDKEFCDPYGECQCRRSDDYVIRYKGKCIHGLEGNKLFCNGNSHSFSLKHSVPRKGGIAYTEKIEDVNCLCYTGFYGNNCERKHENYPDKFPVGDEYFLPEPNCKNDEACGEGMKCSETGFCYCDKEVHFTDPVLKNAVVAAVGKTNYTGLDLINVKKLTLEHAQNLNNMECLPNLRALIMLNPNASVKIEDIAQFKNLQYLIMKDYEFAVFDFSPLLKLEKLLLLGLDLDKDNYKFLEKMDSENHLEAIWFDFEKGDYPESFEFIKKFKRIRSAKLYCGQSANLSDNCLFDIFNLSESQDLQYLVLYPGRCEIKNIIELEKNKELRELMVGNVTTDLNPTRHLNLSDFPVLPNLTTLWIDSVVFDERLIDHFPELTNLHLFGYGIDIKNLDFLSGIKNMRLLYVSENYTDLVPFNEKRYEPIGKMTNLIELDIRNYSSRNYSWVAGLKHVVLFGLSDENRYEENVQDYNENGSDGTDYYLNLLYLSTYIDNTYHIDNVKGFKENCDKNGAFCNSSFWDKYMNENDYFPPSINICQNPVKTEDKDLQYLLEKGVGFIIGKDSQSCEVLSPERANKYLFFNRKQKLDFRMDITDNSGIKWISK